MSHSASDRTEQATPRRLKQARERGLVVRSRDLQAGLFLLAVAGVLAVGPATLLDGAALSLKDALQAAPTAPADSRDLLTGLVWRSLGFCWPFLVILPLAAAVAYVLQTGLIWNPAAMAPDLNRLNPAVGLSRTLSPEGFTRAAAAVLKIGLLVAVAAWWTARPAELLIPVWNAAPPDALELGRSAPAVHASAQALIGLAARFTASLGAAFLAWGGVDYLLQRRRHLLQLQMTPEELREERRQFDPDPLVRRQQQTARRQVTDAGRLLQQIAASDLLLGDGAGRVLALRYRPEADAEPTVVTWGEGPTAARLRQLAEQTQLPVTNRPDLVAALWPAAVTAADLPAAQLPALAELLAWSAAQRPAPAA